MDLPHLEPGELYPRELYPRYENGYPFIYFTEDGGILCPDCANGENGSLANANEEDPQWHLTAMDVHWEGLPEQCDHCGEDIESAYGDPEKEEFNEQVEDARKALSSGPPFDLSDESSRLVAADWLIERGITAEVALAAVDFD